MTLHACVGILTASSPPTLMLSKPHTYSQPSCFSQFHHISCPSTQSKVETGLILKMLGAGKRLVSEVSLTINETIEN